MSLQRIPEGRGEVGNGGKRKQPVIIQHGVLVVSKVGIPQSIHYKILKLVTEKFKYYKSITITIFFGQNNYHYFLPTILVVFLSP